MPNLVRPVFLNLLQIEMPVGAITSIGHRVSGVALAAGVPWTLYLFALSLQGQQGFERVLVLLSYAPIKAGTALMVWALAHHVLAGLRHLLSDFNVGSPLRLARRTAYVVNLGAALIAACALGLLW